MKPQIRPALVLGVGATGARIARQVVHNAPAVVGQLPILQVLPLEDVAADEDVPRIRTALQALRQVEVREAARAQGWTIRQAGQSMVFLLLDGTSVAALPPLLAALAAVPVSNALAVTLIGLQPDAQPSNVVRETLQRAVAALAGAGLVLEGIYGVETTNALGLHFGTPARWETMIADWILELISTPLGLGLAALPLSSDLPWGSFGLARWALPRAALLHTCMRRWQQELYAALLAEHPNHDPLTVPALVDALRAIWPTSFPLPTAPFARWQSLAHLSPAGIADLTTALSSTAAQAQRAVEDHGQYLDTQLDAWTAAARSVLRTHMTAWLDAPGAARLARAQRALVHSMTRCTQIGHALEAQLHTYETQLAALDTTAQDAEAALVAACARFPPWTLRAWWNVLRRPWRWPRLLLQYGRIIQQVRAYVAHPARSWRIRWQHQETVCHLAYWQAILAALDTQQADLRTFRASVSQLHAALAPAPGAAEALAAHLQAAALPPTLVEHLYRRGRAAPASALEALLAVGPSLSDLFESTEGTQALHSQLAEQARERYDFLQYLQLDALLIRTYSAAELRARLAELLDAAAPFWSDDLAQLTPEERTSWAHTCWLGLPGGETSPLCDLVTQPHVHVYPAANAQTITVVQLASRVPAQQGRG